MTFKKATLFIAILMTITIAAGCVPERPQETETTWLNEPVIATEAPTEETTRRYEMPTTTTTAPEPSVNKNIMTDLVVAAIEEGYGELVRVEVTEEGFIQVNLQDKDLIKALDLIFTDRLEPDIWYTLLDGFLGVSELATEYTDDLVITIANPWAGDRSLALITNGFVFYDAYGD